MEDTILFANEVASRVNLTNSEVLFLAKFMGMPKVGGSYRFTSEHIKRLKNAIKVIKDSGKIIVS